jgi:hypothetical protein
MSPIILPKLQYFCSDSDWSLGPKEKRQALQFLDTLIEREKWKKKAASG